MSVIQTPPRGLQDLLGTKNFGNNPSQLAEVVMPVVDIAQFYSLDKLFIPRTTETFAPSPGIQPGDSVNIEVPTGETWFVSKISAAVANIIGANQEVRTRAYIELNQRSSAPTTEDAFLLDKELDITSSGTSGIRDYGTQNWDLGLWLPSGSQIFHQYLEGDDPGCTIAIMAFAVKLLA